MRRFLWFVIGSKLWRAYARTLHKEEVERLLAWMGLDCIENTND